MPRPLPRRLTFLVFPSDLWQRLAVMITDTYILDTDGNAIPEPNLRNFLRWLGHPENRMLWREALPGGVLVSTMFLGFDHNMDSRGPPVLWETMIFGGKKDGYQERYASHVEAYKGHKKAVKLARAARGRRGKPSKVS